MTREAGMDHQIRDDRDDRFLVVRTRGVMNGEDYLDMARAILRHPRHRPGGAALFDHRDLDFSQVTLEDLEKIRTFHREHEDQIGGGKTAILLGPGRVEAWQQLWSQGRKIRSANQVMLFESEAEAIEWLNVSNQS